MCFHTPTCKQEPSAKHPRFRQIKIPATTIFISSRRRSSHELSNIRESNVNSIAVMQGKSVTNNGKSLPGGPPWPNKSNSQNFLASNSLSWVDLTNVHVMQMQVVEVFNPWSCEHVQKDRISLIVCCYITFAIGIVLDCVSGFRCSTSQ